MSDNAKMIFGQNLAFLLDRLGKSQVDVARDLDVSTGIVSEWVRGRKYPRIDKIQALAEYLGVRMSILIEENGISVFTQEETEKRLLCAFRSASPEIQAAALTMLENSAAAKKDTKQSAI